MGMDCNIDGHPPCPDSTDPLPHLFPVQVNTIMFGGGHYAFFLVSSLFFLPSRMDQYTDHSATTIWYLFLIFPHYALTKGAVAKNFWFHPFHWLILKDLAFPGATAAWKGLLGRPFLPSEAKKGGSAPWAVFRPCSPGFRPPPL